MTTDFTVGNHGSIVSFTPNTDAARDFLRENVEAESWQWLGNSLCVDARMAEPLLAGIQDAGLVVGDDRVTT